MPYQHQLVCPTRVGVLESAHPRLATELLSQFSGAGLLFALVLALLPACSNKPSIDASSELSSESRLDESDSNDEQVPTSESTDEVAAVHVHPGDDIQAAIEKVAADTSISTVIVHAGTYCPDEPRQALIWFNKRHNGIHLRAEGDVTLTVANPTLADRSAPSYPAIANHVVYFGDGVGPETRIEGFKITGANNFVSTKGPVIEPTKDPQLKRTAYFYFDGGGIKIFGRSYPTLDGLEIVDNYSSPCGAGVSVEHRGFTEGRVTIRNCVFRNNRVPLTGSALDLLGQDKGSAALVENCLFVNNTSNCSMDDRSIRLGSWLPKVGHGAITVFRPCTGEFRNCTIVENRNGVDDLSSSSTYDNCIFWNNTTAGGWPTGPRYETSLTNAVGVNQCFIGGGINDRKAKIDPKKNVLDAPNPEFDESYVPQNKMYEKAGYRPVRTSPAVEQSVGQAAENVADEPLLVRARGSEFNWYFSYDGKDGIPNTPDDIRTRRHLYLPAGRPIRIQLESDDYLYSLKLPDQGANEIAVPGLVHYCTLQETKPGNYPLNGDQFCGYAHPNLIGRVIVQPPALFAKSLTVNRIQ